MENQVMSSPSSSSPQPENSKDMTVAVEESKEKTTENNNNNNLSLGSSSQEVTSERTSENPSLGSGAVQTGRELTMLYPSRSNKIYTCQFCSKGFSTTQALGGHQNAHKHDREWEKKRKEMDEDFPGLSFLNSYIEKPHLLLGGYSEHALSNDNHLGITLESFKRRGRGLVPRMTPTRFFTGNTFTDSSSSRGLGPRPSYNNYHPMLLRNNGPPFPPRATNLPSRLYLQDNETRVENLISKVGKDKVVEIDDDDDDEEGESKSWGNELSLSL